MAKDRLRSEHEYRVNLKAELEVRLLGTRFDVLFGRQWQHLMESKAPGQGVSAFGMP